ncbi:hypothetical protein E1211_00780 [Micromonospora sp. 15K316]|uniref:hypothetical protein n=1 Tax=Micromonospora sp. 15K316 TaxID=2530376 RepID=UPI0010475C18|nr:hypothetical protein [Micromonospora sp. 15K316]TDC40674.1 hypothetical protein E1211_00780 [Micromonospora sp. 15K316]
MTRLPTEPAATTDVQPVVIATDNTFAHAYASVGEMLSDRNLRAKGGLEFFDRSGRRLAPLLTDAWEVRGLVPTSDEPDPALLQGRLAAVIRHVGDYIRRHPEVVAGMPADEAVAALPHIGKDTLAEDVAKLPGAGTPSGGTVGPMDSGGWFHNAMHAAGWAH